MGSVCCRLGVSHFAESSSPVLLLPESAPVSQLSTECHSWSCVVADSASFYGRRDRAVLVHRLAFHRCVIIIVILMCSITFFAVVTRSRMSVLALSLVQYFNLCDDMAYRREKQYVSNSDNRQSSAYVQQFTGLHVHVKYIISGQGLFRGHVRTPFPIEKLQERMGTVFPLLKC